MFQIKFNDIYIYILRITYSKVESKVSLVLKGTKWLQTIIPLILFIIMAITPVHAAAIASDTKKTSDLSDINTPRNNIEFKARYIKTPVKDVNMWIITTLINSPYNGHAEIKQTYQYSWSYGFISSRTVTISTQQTLSASNGEAVALAQYWHVRFYEVEECIAGCVPRGYIAEPINKIDGIRGIIFAYQQPGSLIDNTIIEIQTVDENNRVVAIQRVDPSFEEADDFLMFNASTACYSYTITYSKQTTTGLEMAIGTTIGGEFSMSFGTIHLSFTKASQNQVTYTFCAKPGYTIIYYIDYKGTYNEEKKPLIWSFYTELHKGKNNITTEKLIKYITSKLHIIKKHKRIIRKPLEKKR